MVPHTSGHTILVITFNGISVILLEDVVGHDDCGKNREALLGVEGRVVVVGVHARNLDVVARLDLVAQVTQQDHVLGARQASRGHLAAGDSSLVTIRLQEYCSNTSHRPNGIGKALFHMDLSPRLGYDS